MSTENTPAVPEVKLPRAVLENKARIEKMLKERQEAKPTQATQLIAETVATPQTVTSTVTTPEVTTTVVEPEKDAKYWEHRFKTSQGMFEAEKTRLRSERENLQKVTSGLEGQIKELNDKLRTAERSTPSTFDLTKILSKEQIDTYGPEVLQSVVQVATRAAEEAAERRIKDVDAEVDRKVRPVQDRLNQAEQDAQNNREQRFWETLETRFPAWAVVNDDPKWHEWLSQIDPFTGIQRQNLLTQAQTSFDANRVVAMFSAFKSSLPAPQAPSVQQRVVPEPVAAAPILENEAGVEFVKRSEITRFYDDVKLGRYKLRPQDKEKFEKKLRAAQLAGKIING